VIPTFVIFLREGIEASMIVAILLAYLKKIEKREHFRDVLLGVFSAFAFVVVAGVCAYFFIKQYDGSNTQTYFETATYLIAAAALTYMTFWMQSHARGLSKELQQKSELALTRGSRIGLSLIAFNAVAREGLETMVFTLAIIFTNSRQSGAPLNGNLLWLGAIAGIVVSLLIAFYIYKIGAKLNLKVFFQVLGLLLMVFAAGLIADSIQNFQELGWIKFGNAQIWNSSKVLSENSNFGDVLHSLIGYADHPTILQSTTWIFYFVIVASFFIYKGKIRRKPLNN
jgi:high-affinity iron transporter